MGMLIQVLIYAAIAGAAWAAIHGFDLSRQKIGADAQLAKDTPIINACKIDRDTAVKANVGLQADVARIGDERDQQSKAVKELQDQMAAQQADKAKRIAAAKPKLDALRTESATLEQRLAANTEGKTCDEKLSNVDRDLRAIVGGVRVVAPGAPSGNASQNVAPGVSAGRGSLRLSK